MHQSSFSTTAGTALAHALVASIAHRAGLRVLSIKGPVSDAYGLRRPHAAADTDVWVAPSDFQALSALLEARGWHERHKRETPTVLPRHSRTYIHDNWPCDIDLHWSFPGFFADDDAVFDWLWSRREALTIAHTTVQIPSRPGAAAIGMLHGLRKVDEARNISEREQITGAIRETFSDAERAEFVALARLGRAQWVMRDVIAEAGLANPVVDIDDADQRRWILNTHYGEGNLTVAWWLELRATAWHRKPAYLLRALWVPRDEQLRNDPLKRPTRHESWAYQVARWRRAAQAMAKYMRRRGR